MYFELTDYINHLFWWQVLHLFTAVLVIVSSLYSIFIRRKLKEFFVALFFLTFSIMLLMVALSNLKYGYPLRNEQDQQPIILQGEISDLEKARNAPRFSDDDGYMIAHIVTIDEKEYYVMSVKGLSIGDEVEISCYPESKVVISIILIE